nr:hypothetical protein [Tanacetum cinerariifolium]
MSSASSIVTYTSIYIDSETRRVFWGADEELSDDSPPRVIVYAFDGLPMQSVVLPLPDYIPSPEEPHDPDYVPEPIYPEYIPLEDDHVFLVEKQPLPLIDSPSTESPGYVADSDPEEDPEEYEDEKTKNGLSLPPPSTDTTTTRARITVWLQASIPLSPEAEALRLASAHALIDAVTAALPSPPLPPPIYIPSPVNHRDDIPETEMPPHKRSYLFALGSGFGVDAAEDFKENMLRD